MGAPKQIKNYRWLKLANAFGIFAYLSLITQWIWTAVLLSPLVLQNKAIKSWIIPTPTEPQAPLIVIEQPSPLLVVSVLLITALVLVGTVVIALRLPRQIGRTARNSTHGIAHHVVPIITHHKAISKQRQRQLSLRVILTLKLVVSLLPITVLLLPVVSSRLVLPVDIAIFVAATTAIMTLLWFSSEYLVARWHKLPAKHLY